MDAGCASVQPRELSVEGGRALILTVIRPGMKKALEMIPHGVLWCLGQGPGVFHATLDTAFVHGGFIKSKLKKSLLQIISQKFEADHRLE